MSETSSVERAFAILEAFARERRPLALKELSEICSIPSSTCHTLVHAMLKRGYLYQGPRKDLYPTRKLHDMGAIFLANDRIVERLLPVMEHLRDTTRETVILGRRQRDHVLYLEVLEGPQVIRYTARPGDTKPLHSSSIGKTLLSVLTERELHGLLPRLPLDKVTPSTIVDAEALLPDLSRGRERGWFETHGENVPDVSALSVPIALNNDQFGLAVAGPSHRVEAQLGAIADALLAAQASLAEQA